VLDATAIRLIVGNSPDVAALGDTFLTVTSWLSSPEIRQIAGARIRGSDGVVLDASPVVIGGNFSLSPHVSRFGSRWLATWETHPSHDNPASSVNASFVRPDGTPVSTFLVSSAAYSVTPDVAAAADTAVIVWSDNRTGASGGDIFARRLLLDGTLLDSGGFPVASAANAQTQPAVAWDGSLFVSAYHDDRNVRYLDAPRADIYGTRFTASRIVLDPTAFAVMADTIPDLEPSVASVSGVTVMAGSTFRPAAPYAAYRFGFRLLTGGGGAAAASLAPGPGANVEQTANVSTSRPSLGGVVIHYTLRTSAHAVLRIFAANGQLVRTLVNGEIPSGSHEARWDGRTDMGTRAHAGVYLYHLEAGGVRENGKAVLMQ
jgi:hypothetical protein